MNVSFESKARFLEQPGVYPGDTRTVESIDTHMSRVFLTETFAYKMKKPIRTPFLDFSTREKRRRDCEREIQLNRRLAGEVYIEVVPLTRTADGSLHLRGEGNPVEWLVKMKRLPRDRMLDQRIREGTVRTADLFRTGRYLSRFYSTAEPLHLDPGEYPARLEWMIRENHRALLDPDFGLPREPVKRGMEPQLAWLSNNMDLLERRNRDGRLIEGHGDLRPDHVCLTRPPVIFDCIEFKRAFRVVDPLDEQSFLSMECMRLDAPRSGG